MDKQLCPLCHSRAAKFSVIQEVIYLECLKCDFIFADPDLLEKVDAGIPLRQYDEAYWLAELASARERSYGSSLARLAEAVLYCRIPVNKVIDIGTGPGYLLDAIAAHLPSKSRHFYGVEKFPPEPGLRTVHPNYRCADLADIPEKFECGVCIEVLEHLTPRMAEGLADAMCDVAVDGSLFLFNTGLTQYVRKEDPGYLDPYGRGHITCWSVTAARRVFEPRGFRVHPLRGKAWAFVLEFGGMPTPGVVEDRVWTAPEHNKQLLQDASMGSLLYILGRESARAY